MLYRGYDFHGYVTRPDDISGFFGISKVVTSQIPWDRINLKKESNGFRAANRVSGKEIVTVRKR